MLFPCAIRKLSYGSNRILIEARVVKSQSSNFGPVDHKRLTDRSMCYIQVIISRTSVLSTRVVYEERTDGKLRNKQQALARISHQKAGIDTRGREMMRR